MHGNDHGSTGCALVAGGSRGIGAAIARRLAEDGFAVAVNYAGNDAAAAEVTGAIAAAGGSAIAVRADISDPHAAAHAWEQAEAALGPIRVLVNAAGIMQLSPIATTGDEIFDRVVSVNLKGTFSLLRLAAQRMPEGGRVVTVSSSVVGLKLPTYGAYAASKAAVETLSAIMAREMRGRGITVNAIAPGPVATALFLDGKTPEQIEALSRANPMERLGQPEDIAAAVAFLAGPDGGWVNGQVLRANGGMV